MKKSTEIFVKFKQDKTKDTPVQPDKVQNLYITLGGLKCNPALTQGYIRSQREAQVNLVVKFTRSSFQKVGKLPNMKILLKEFRQSNINRAGYTC